MALKTAPESPGKDPLGD